VIIAAQSSEAQDIRGLKSGIDAKHAHKCAKQQTSAGEQDKAQSDFAENQRVLPSMRRGRKTAAALLETRGKIDSRGTQCGCQAKNGTGDERDAKCKCKGGRVEVNLTQSHQRFRSQSQQSPQCRPAYGYGSDSAEDCEQHAFRKKLADHAPAGSTHRHANDRFAFAIVRPRQQQVGHVSASNQKNKTDPAKQNREYATNIANVVVLQRDQRKPIVLIGVTFHRRAQSRRDGVRFRLSFLKAGAAADASDEVQKRGAAGLGVSIRKQRVHIGSGGNVRVVGKYQTKIFGKNADDGHRARSDKQSLIDNVRVRAEFSAPKPVGNNRDGRRIGRFILWREKSPHDKPAAQQRKEATGYVSLLYGLGLRIAVASDQAAADPDAADFF